MYLYSIDVNIIVTKGKSFREEKLVFEGRESGIGNWEQLYPFEGIYGNLSNQTKSLFIFIQHFL